MNYDLFAFLWSFLSDPVSNIVLLHFIFKEQSLIKDRGGGLSKNGYLYHTKWPIIHESGKIILTYYCRSVGCKFIAVVVVVNLPGEEGVMSLSKKNIYFESFQK